MTLVGTRDAWRTVASQLGTDVFFTKGMTAFGPGEVPKMVAIVDGVTIRVGVGLKIWRISARCQQLHGLQAHMRPGHVYPLARAFGARDEILGHPSFDLRFVVKTDDLAHARAWITDRACALMDQTLRFEFGLSKTTAWASVYQGQPEKAAELASALAAVATLARGGQFMAERWAEVAGALGAQLASDGAGEEPARWTISVDGIPVVGDLFVGSLGDRKRARRLFTRLRARVVASSARPFVVYRHREQKRRDRPSLAGKLSRVHPRRLRARDRDYRFYGGGDEIWHQFDSPEFAASRPLAVVGDGGTVTGYLRGFVTDPLALRAAAGLVGRLAFDANRSRSDGPYR